MLYVVTMKLGFPELQSLCIECGGKSEY